MTGYARKPSLLPSTGVFVLHDLYHKSKVIFMEYNFPKLDLFPKITRVATGIAHLLRYNPESGYGSDHSRGAEHALDASLYDKKPQNRWDSLGYMGGEDEL